MDQNMTGLNIQQAEADIKNFHDSCNKVYTSFYSAFGNLLLDLNRSWASPVAQTYTKSLIIEINEMLRNYIKERNILLQNASTAASILASANGAKINGYFNISEDSIPEILFEANPCEDNINGVVGMDVAAINTIISSFNIQLKSALLQLDNLPKGIGLYDQNNELISTYNMGIDHFSTEFNSLFDKIKKDLEEYMKTETDNILLAKQQATETMSA